MDHIHNFIWYKLQTPNIQFVWLTAPNEVIKQLAYSESKIDHEWMNLIGPAFFH